MKGILEDDKEEGIEKIIIKSTNRLFILRT